MLENNQHGCATWMTQHGCAEIQQPTLVSIFWSQWQTWYLVIIWLMLTDMIIWIPWKKYSAAEQWNEANTRDNEANNKRHYKEHKKGVVRILPNTEHKCQKEINEHNLETNTTVCEYLKYSRHENLFLRK